MQEFTTTAYAILGLIAVEEGSAYALAQRMKRNYRFFWPRAQSHFYSEVKRLVKSGLTTAHRERVGRRGRTVYRITKKGIAALADWLDRPASPPSLECEGLLRVSYADFGNKAQLIRQLEAMRDHADQVLATGAEVAFEYANGKVEMPDRVHSNRLLWKFLWDQYQAQANWARWAIDEVEQWPDPKPHPESLERANRFFRDTVADLMKSPAANDQTPASQPQPTARRRKARVSRG